MSSNPPIGRKNKSKVIHRSSGQKRKGVATLGVTIIGALLGKMGSLSTLFDIPLMLVASDMSS